MTAIEKVARAICRAGICGPKSHLDEQENLHWRKYEIEAKASMQAMQSSTDEMESGYQYYMAGND